MDRDVFGMEISISGVETYVRDKFAQIHFTENGFRKSNDKRNIASKRL